MFHPAEQPPRKPGVQQSPVLATLSMAIKTQHNNAILHLLKVSVQAVFQLAKFGAKPPATATGTTCLGTQILLVLCRIARQSMAVFF
jgi:hypothetical protein